MKVDLCPSVNLINLYQLSSSTAIVIDVLRATSCIVTALYHGCSCVVPVSTPEEAFNQKKLSPQEVLLGGERHSRAVKGFDVGNSPQEYLQQDLQQKKLVITTTNGTRAIKAASISKNLLIGSILNAKATAEKACRLKAPVILVCSGTRDKFSLDDFITAGLIVNELQQLKKVNLTDFAQTALIAYHFFEESIVNGLKTSQHGHQLVEMNLESDLVFCSQVNKYPIVAQYTKGEISKENDEIS